MHLMRSVTPGLFPRLSIGRTATAIFVCCAFRQENGRLNDARRVSGAHVVPVLRGHDDLHAHLPVERDLRALDLHDEIACVLAHHRDPCTLHESEVL